MRQVIKGGAGGASALHQNASVKTIGILWMEIAIDRLVADRAAYVAIEFCDCSREVQRGGKCKREDGGEDAWST